MPWIRIISGSLLLLIAGVIALNVVGRVTFDVDRTYTGKFREGPYDGKKLSADGVRVLKDWIETRTRPAWDPYRIAWHQFWYNAVTADYDLSIWVEPPDVSSHRYGVYVSNDMLFLRREYSGRNRVLNTSFSVDDLVEALEPYVVQ